MQAFLDIRNQSKANRISDMTLEEINEDRVNFCFISSRFIIATGTPSRLLVYGSLGIAVASFVFVSVLAILRTF